MRTEYFVSCEFEGESMHRAFGTNQGPAREFFDGAIRDGAVNVTLYSLTFDASGDCIDDTTIATF